MSPERRDHVQRTKAQGRFVMVLVWIALVVTLTVGYRLLYAGN